MTLHQIKEFVKNNNLGRRTRQRYYIHNRMYIYQILYFHFNFSLNRIGAFIPYYDKKNECLKNWDHTTVRHSLIEAFNRKDHKDFLKHTKKARELFPFEIKEYVNKDSKFSAEDETFDITVTLNKKQYINYMKGRDINFVYDIVWKLTLDKLNNRVNRIK